MIDWKGIVESKGLWLIPSDHINQYSEFRHHVNKRDVLKNSGVYVVTGIDITGFETPMYVGGCINLCKRLRSHDVVRAICKNENIVAFNVYCKPTQDFKQEEIELIRGLDPVYNSVYRTYENRKRKHRQLQPES